MTPRPGGRGGRFVQTVAALVLVSSATLVVDGASPGTSSANTSQTLLAEGGSFPGPLVGGLQNSSAGVASIAPLAPGFFQANIDQARSDFASGAADYAVSEFPLTSAQAATAAANGRSFAYVPFAMSGVAIGAILICNDTVTLTPTTLCPDIQLTTPLLAEVFSGHVTSWADPTYFAHASDGGPITADSESAQVHPVNQVDPSIVNYALQSLFVGDPTAKAIWDAFDASYKVTNDTPTETWPTGGGVSDGDLGVVEQLIPVNPATTEPETDPQTWGGGDIAGIPIDWLGQPWNVPTVSIQNAAGDFVFPTATSLQAAENDATLDPTTNLVTFNADASDAAVYPLPVMEYLIVPTTGLSQAKATALASFIRYVLGAQGQSVIEQFGDVPPTAAMVSAGMQVADTVAAEATTPTTSTTTTTAATNTTKATTTTTSATTKATTTKSTTGTGTSSSGGSDAGSGGASASGSASSGASLAATGGPPWQLPALAGAMLMIGVCSRRVFRRRLARTRGPAL